MAIKGLSIPVFGKYNYDPVSKTVFYTDGLINPAAIEYTAAIESTEDNPLYGDNRVIENDTARFNTGTLELGVDDLVNKVSVYLCGMKEIEETYGVDGKTAKTLIADDAQMSPVLGTGIIEEHQNNGATTYKAVIFLKTTYTIPEDAATTRGASVDWQTKTISAKIERSEEEGEKIHPWKKSADFPTESEALEYLKYMLGVLDVINITSAEGEPGKTKITVAQDKGTASQYFYMIGSELELPVGGETLGEGYQEWDGSEEITAETGNQIVIVECVDRKAVRAGIVDVKANAGG